MNKPVLLSLRVQLAAVFRREPLIRGRMRSIFLSLAICLSTVGLYPGSAGAHSPPTVTSGLTSTPPTIDGVLSPGEWADAASFPFTVGGLPGTAHVMNDGTYLYVGATISDPSCCGLNSFQLFFDNSHDGVVTAGDDALVTNLGNNFAFDDYYNGACCFLFDTSAGGTNDITAFGADSSGLATFEVRHPLCSADTAHDFCLSSGSRVGFDIVYQSGNGATFGGFPTSSFSDQSGFGDLIIAPVDTTPPTLTVFATPSVLWPPSHRLVPISVSVSASDDSGSVSVVLVSITSNEPDEGLGDGDTANDVEQADFGAFDADFLLRAERSGTGSGRVYTITYEATDPSGNTTTASAAVTVPVSQRP
jgi:endo-1,4-beta-xylanase